MTNHTYLGVFGQSEYPITNALHIQPLRDVMDVTGTIMKLKGSVKQAELYESNVEKVRASLQDSAYAAQVAGRADEIANQINTPAKFLRDALIMGVHAQNLTFLSIVNRFYRGRVMRFPKGIAGAESYAGPPQYANEPNPWDAFPQRKLPLRSSIRHNVDEWVGDHNYEAEFDEEALWREKTAKEFNSIYTLEMYALTELAEMGLDPVQHPGGSPFDTSHLVTAGLAIGASTIARYGFGVGIGT